MARTPSLDLNKAYLNHLDKEENKYALVRSSGLDDLLVDSLRAKELIAEIEACQIKSYSRNDQFSRGLEFFGILRSDPMRFATLKKIEDFIAVLKHEFHKRPSVEEVFSSFRDEHLNAADADVDGVVETCGRMQSDLRPDVRGTPSIVIGECQYRQETSTGLVVKDGSVVTGAINIDMSKTNFNYR